MPIPSQAPEKSGEGVETGWAAPKGLMAHGEGTVQTTNVLSDRDGRRLKSKWYESWGRRFESSRGHHFPEYYPVKTIG